MSDHMRIAKMDPQQLLNKKIEMELKRAHENKKTSHAARLGSITLKGPPSLSMSRSQRLLTVSANLTPRDTNSVSMSSTSIEEGSGKEEDE